MDAEHYRVRDFLTRTAMPAYLIERINQHPPIDVTKRVAAAVGEGSMVAALVFTRLAELGVTV